MCVSIMSRDLLHCDFLCSLWILFQSQAFMVHFYYCTFALEQPFHSFELTSCFCRWRRLLFLIDLGVYKVKPIMWNLLKSTCKSKTDLSPAGVEPGPPSSESICFFHWTSRPQHCLVILAHLNSYWVFEIHTGLDFRPSLYVLNFSQSANERVHNVANFWTRLLWQPIWNLA